MTFKTVVIAAALTIAALLSLAFTRGWLWFYCEGFGCNGVGVLYLLINALVVVAFFISGVCLGPAPRLSLGLFAGGVALVAIMLAIGVILIEAQWRISQDWEETEKACAQHPDLCPETDNP